MPNVNWDKVRSFVALEDGEAEVTEEREDGTLGAPYRVRAGTPQRGQPARVPPQSSTPPGYQIAPKGYRQDPHEPQMATGEQPTTLRKLVCSKWNGTGSTAKPIPTYYYEWQCQVSGDASFTSTKFAAVQKEMDLVMNVGLVPSTYDHQWHLQELTGNGWKTFWSSQIFKGS